MKDGWFRELARRFLFQTSTTALTLDRERAGREASPSAAVIDGPSVKAPQAKRRSYDAGKKIVGASAISQWISTGGS